MNRLHLLIIIATISSGSVFIGGYLTADKSKYSNDFVRLFPPHAADANTSFQILGIRNRLAGYSSGKIYVYNQKRVLIINLDHLDSVSVEFKIPLTAELLIDTPYFFINDGSKAILQRGDISDWKIDTTFIVPNFTAIQPYSGAKSIVRTIDISNRRNLLQTSDGSKELTLKKQVDGLLCTDGLLQYSKSLHQVIYTYRYRNQFICMDTNLNVVRFGKTIDTTSVAKIAVAEVDGKITMAKPPLAVNNDAYVDGKFLFVQSNLEARNEPPAEEKGRKVIDVYDLLDGSYRFSFYIRPVKDITMDSFIIRQHNLVAFFHNTIVVYDIPTKYLQ